ncbi:Tetratricopeptide repeat protein [Rubripirellula lacrimiformis]|uniref:Tetratricopeptide repeat protein n=1 Tax=Rubripirellula lacrimiformis TaxID=1930273 RepID=A0A517N6H0_9BACT|nr:tetratricopeptide repeat protein [Rubripirellula lacrimiformis]QDT02733.1 Tetratricopeptide repeat protein [Rubripirellula lacrimiformis]
MADPKPNDQAKAGSPKRSDTVTTALMAAAALVAVGGFAMLFSLWWRSGVTDSYEVLRVAAQEFVAGRPILAGELAQTVRFEGEPEPLKTDPDTGDPIELPPPEEEVPQIADPDVELTAEEIEAQAAADIHQEWIRLRDFLIGAGRVAQVEQVEDIRERRQLLIDAIKPLEAARNNGFPVGRQTEGYQILGMAQYRLGRFSDAADSLLAAVERDPTLRRQLRPIIAEVQLRSGGVAVAAALDTINEHLRDGSLTHRQRWAATLIQLRSLVELKRFGEANTRITELLAIPFVSDVTLQAEQVEFRNEVSLVAAIIEVMKATGRYGPFPATEFEDRSDAIKDLAQTDEELGRLQRESGPQTSAKARLWLARSLLVQGRQDESLSHLTAVRSQRPFGAMAILGGLEEIELLARLRRGDEVLQTTRYMMREIADPSGFDADAVTFKAFKRRLSSAIENLRRGGDYPNAIDTARSLPPVIDVADALSEEAIGYGEWAEATIRDGTDVSGELARSASILARSRFRASGDAYAQSAQLNFDTKKYLPAQWSAIDAYQKGRHFRRSIRLLEPYLRYEERQKLPRGLVAYGRALLAEGAEDKAIQAVETCIVEYPRDPLRYDARLLAAEAHAERQELDKARQYLMDNLQDGELTPQSPAWRDSLLRLGELVYEQAYQGHLAAEQATGEQAIQLMRENQPVLEEAIRYLEEAVERYEKPATLNAAYLAARCHVLAANWPRIEAESPEILEAAKRSLRTRADQELQIALDSFTNLRSELVMREEEVQLPPNEEAMLRNCYLAEASTMRQMDRLEDASTAYRTVELRYMNEPTALEAILGRVACAKDLGRTKEADLLIRQAYIVLGRIPPDYDDRFADTTRFDRKGWEQYLTWMNNRITEGGV